VAYGKPWMGTDLSAMLEAYPGTLLPACIRLTVVTCSFLESSLRRFSALSTITVPMVSTSSISVLLSSVSY
jgi:hypothetical protein